MNHQSFESKLSKEQSKILKFVKNGTYAEVQGALKHFQRLEKDEFFGYVLLVSALQRKHKSISKFLMKKGCKVQISSKTRLYCTPLYYAVELNDLEIFKALRKKGASVFNKDANKETALELAMHQRKYEIIEFLLDEIISQAEKELNPNCKNDIALFHAACWIRHLEAIQMFVFYKFSMKTRSTFYRDEWKGCTTLHFALLRPYLDGQISWLLKHDEVDFHARNKRGTTLLHLIFRNKYSFMFTDEIPIERINPCHGRRFKNLIDENGLEYFHIFCGLKIRDWDTAEHIDIIKYFIHNGANVNSSLPLDDQRFPGFTVLHFAARKLSLHVLKILLENHADPKKSNKNGQTPLHIACRKSQKSPKECYKVVKLLLDHGADPNAKNPQDRTPLHEAFYTHSHIQSLNNAEKLILSRNLQGINHSDKNGLSYLHIACLGDDLSVVKTLIAKGASVNSCIRSTPHYDGCSPLHFAARCHKFEIVQYLLTHGADVSSCTRITKATSLHFACNHEFLKSNRLNEYDVEEDDDEVEWLPSQENDIQTIESLIEHGAFVNAEDRDCSTPLLWNFELPLSLYIQDFQKGTKLFDRFLNELFSRQVRAMDILLNHGANINASSNREGSILHILTRSYKECPLNKKLAEIALKRGADVNFEEKTGYTPLNRAIAELFRNHHGLEMFELFLKYGANVNLPSKVTGTPLCHVITCCNAKQAHQEVFQKLLDHPDIDINVQNLDGKSPLHHAIHLRKSFAVDKLLEYGADINLEDQEGNSPIDDFANILEGDLEMLEDEDHYKILLVLIIHIKKLMRLNFFVSEKVRKCHEELSSCLIDEGLAEMDSDIDAEIKAMKAEKLDQYTSLYDIIFKDSNSMAKHEKNFNLAITSTFIELGWEYNFFGDIIRRQLKKGRKRYLILEPAKTALYYLTSVNLPDSCSENIFSHLSDQNLKNLIDCIPDRELYKRSLEDVCLTDEPLLKIARIDI